MGAIAKVGRELHTLCKNVHIAKQARHDSRLILLFSYGFYLEMQGDPDFKKAVCYPAEGTRCTMLGLPLVVDAQQKEPFKFVMEF